MKHIHLNEKYSSNAEMDAIILFSNTILLEGVGAYGLIKDDMVITKVGMIVLDKIESIFFFEGFLWWSSIGL